MLLGSNENEKEIFPVIPTIYKRFSLFFRILIFTSISIAAICLFINYFTFQNRWWSLYVILGLAGMWAEITAAVRKRSNISKNVLYQIVILSLMIAGVDWLTGWNKWSVDYVIPSLFAFSILTVAIIAMIMYRRVEDYLVYLFINGLLGITPLIFVFTGICNVVWPSLSCVLVSTLSLSGTMLFTGADAIGELKKRMHM